MRSFYIALAISALVATLPPAAALSNSLADCQAIAASFNNTCDTSAGPVADITATTGSAVSCASSLFQTCPGTSSNGICTYYHKLCVTCSTVDGVTRIRVQSNGLPPRCAKAPSMTQVNYDFEVNFNPAVSSTSVQRDFSSYSQSAFSSAVCSPNYCADTNIPSSASYTKKTSTNYDNFCSVAVDGIPVFNPNNAESQDPYYPVSGSGEITDGCLSHPDFSYNFHYHISSSCMVNPGASASIATTTCDQLSSCSGKISSYNLAMWDNYKTLTVIGIAKDGHVVYGPYDSTGTQVTSYDACGGTFYDSNGNYAYFAKNTYPYTINCFGSASYPCYAPTCTTNFASSGKYNRSAYISNPGTCDGSGSTTSPAHSARATANVLVGVIAAGVAMISWLSL